MKKSAGFNPQPPRPAWGVRPAPRKTQSTGRPILVAPAPKRVVIPIQQCLGLAAEPLVTTGQQVLTGEPIASAISPLESQYSPRIHASISGTVAAIEEHIVPAATEVTETCVVIDGDGRDASYTAYENLGDPMKMEPTRIRQLIAEAGIVGLGGALFSTAAKLATPDDVHTLILNGAECEPYITCDDILMRQHAKRIVYGAQIMMRAVGATRIIVGLENDMPEARVAIWDVIESGGFDNVFESLVTAKYPAGGERQLIQLIMDEEVPEAGLPSDIGYVCQNVGTAAAVADFFEDGRPLISRVVTVTGRGITEPVNIDVRIGTSMADVFDIAGGVKENASHLIMGGPMMGVTLHDLDYPVTKATNCLILMTPNEISPTHEEMPCIRCGECSQVCPAQLLPQELLTAGRQQNMAGLVEFGLNACIECGCCDYVCPSQILLTDTFVTAKAELTEYMEETQRATRARNRFEARETRLAERDAQRTSNLEQQVSAAQATDAIDDIMARVEAKNEPNTGDP